MTDSRLGRFGLVRIYVPVRSDDGRFGDFADEVRSVPEDVDAILGVIQKFSFAGKVGHYSGVFEAAPGYEGYWPEEGSNPTHGAVGQRSLVRSVCITTYVPEDVSDADIVEFLEALDSAHPWEHPVIEVWCRGEFFLWYAGQK